MPKVKQMPNLSLSGFNDIFASTVDAALHGNGSISTGLATSETDETGGERVSEIPLAELHSPEFHPFNVNDDEAMERLSLNIKQHGVREPGLARPRTGKDGNPDGYELLCGNRRRRACEIAEIPTMPVIIREMDDDSATIAMVDSNLESREKLLFSERAWAYRVKLEALNHQGVKSETPGQLSVEILCEQTGESKNQIFRLVRLTELIMSLIDKVDGRQIAFNPAVELSYLSKTEQAAVAEAMERHETKPSLSQAKRLKELSQSGELDDATIDAMLSETKKPPSGEPTGSVRFRRYFPPDYTKKQMDEVIIGLLKTWSDGQGETA